MARTPGDADKRMLVAAKKMAMKAGCSSLCVREIAAKAGVNLGMFHYHFKSKDRLKRLVLQEIYESFFERLMQASKEGDEAIDQLRNTLLAIGRFIRDERRFYLSAIKDIANEDAEVIRFVAANFPRHASVIHGLILRCQAEGSMAKIPFPQAIAFIMSSINIPTLIATAMEKHGRLKMTEYFEDKAIEQRIDLALKGLRP